MQCVRRRAVHVRVKPDKLQFGYLPFPVIVILPFQRQPFSVILVHRVQGLPANIFGRRGHSTWIVSFPTYLSDDALFTRKNWRWLEEAAAADKNGRKKCR